MIRLCLILWALMVGAVQAQEIPVRSGEHDNFTRLVFDVASDAPWSLAQEGARLTMTFPEHRGGFDTGQIFNRIDRSRVATVSETQSALAVELACNCTATAFASGPDMVVLDVSDAPDQTRGPVSERNPPASTQDAVILGFGATLTGPVAPPSVTLTANAPAPLSLAETEPVPLPPTTPRLANLPPALPVPFDIDDAQGHLALEDAQDRLSREVAQAATRGVLKPNGQTVSLPAPGGRSQIDTSVFQDPPLPVANDGDTDAGETMRITTSIDFQGTALPSELTTSPYGPGCIDPEGVNIAAWADDRPMPAQIAEARRPLYGEFDTLNPSAAETLGRLYLHFGFGPEAARTLQLDPDVYAASGILLEMADIMEFGHVRAPQLLPTYVQCDSALALWAILSLEQVPTTTVINTRAALRTLSALPAHLRNVLAPELSRRLLAYGDEAGAATALRSVERLPGAVSDDTKMAQADLDLAKDQLPQAQEKLEQVVASNSAQSALALIKTVTTQIEQDLPISPDTALLVEAYALELRDDPLGSDLRKLQVLTLARSGQFENAMAAIDALPRDQQAAERAALTDQVVAELTDQGDDMSFLDMVFDLQADRALDVTQITRQAVADRLLSLGFATAASTVIEQVQIAQPSDAVLLLKARIALALKQPALAQAHLLGVTGEDADMLRAQALTLKGDLADASQLFTASGDTDMAQTTAFLSPDWQDRVPDDAPLVGPLARLSKTPLGADPARDGMLARSAAALDESAEARSYIDSLLRAPMDDAPAPES